MHPRTRTIRSGIALMALSSCSVAAATDATAITPEIWGPAVRMVLSLGAVLAVLAGCAWFAKRLRDGGRFKSGIIEVVSGISLGGRDKVVLLRVGTDEVLVGISPTGMRPLHVLRERAEPREFEQYLEATQTMEIPR